MLYVRVYGICLIICLSRNALCSAAFSLENDPFVVVWNSETARCKPHFNVDVNVSHYGITVNAGLDGWRGDVVTLVTGGVWPIIDKTGKPLNGGIPQVGKTFSFFKFDGINGKAKPIKLSDDGNN